MPLLDTDALRRHVEWLSAGPRESATPGERAAGERIAAILEDLGFAVHRDPEQVHGTYWWPIGIPTAGAALGGLAAAARPGARRRRVIAALAGAAAAASAADDISAGPRVLRGRLPRRETVNVWGEIGPQDAARTVIVVAHHDAAHSGLVFEPELPRAILRRLPRDLLERHANTTPPTLWGAVAGPALVALGALAGRARITAAGAVLSAGYAAAMADIGLRAVVPGANDNASGVAAALSLAHWLATDRPADTRAVILSPGAEESFMEGMTAWCDRHLHRFDPATTTVIVLDTVGSPRLLVLEGEGMLTMQEYPKDLVEAFHAAAAATGVELVRDLRFRNATDGLITLKRGFRTAMLGSCDEFKLPPNYHWPTDTADRVDHTTVADAAALCRRMIERLAR
jgi:Peptidase family M28